MTDIGKWTPLIALAIYLLIDAARRVGVDRIPRRWRWLRPVAMAGLAEMAQVLLMGCAFDQAVRHAIYAAIGAMGLRGLEREVTKKTTGKGNAKV